jgi:hypothetical protein
VNVIPPTVTRAGRTTVFTGNIYVQYIVKDVQTNAVINMGEAKLLTAGATMLTYQITIPADVTKRMAPYTYYQILIYVFSEDVAVPAYASITVQAQPSLPQIIGQQIGSAVNTLQSSVTDLSSKVDRLHSELSDASSSISDLRNAINTLNNAMLTLSNFVTALTALVIITLIINIVLIFRVMKK